jgi:hypothetical protein
MNVIPTERDSPSKGTNEALVVLDTFDGKFFRGIKFRMVIYISIGEGRRRIPPRR